MIEYTVTAYSVYFTLTALVVMTTVVSLAVYAIKKLDKKINSEISSFDDLFLVRSTINFDMFLVWPALCIVASFLGTMIFLVSQEYIGLNIFLNNMVLYLFGTIILGRWSKVNEDKLRSLKADDPELANIYQNMLKDWRKRWFSLLPMSSYRIEPKNLTVREIKNYTEM